MSPVMSSAAHRSYQHEAFLYSGGDDFLAGTVPFVRDGLALGEPVMVAVTEPRLGMLREALGPDARDVHFIDMAELGENPARIIPAWRTFANEHGPGRPVRGIGEPIWVDRRPTEIVECQLHEALLNMAVEENTPLWLRCPYDKDALAAPVLREALHTHPTLVDADHSHGSPAYRGLPHVVEMFRQPLPEPTGHVEELSFAGPDLTPLRRLVAGRAADAGLGAARAGDLTLAATEVATNSVRHGGGGGRLRMWQQPDAFVMEVTDGGHIDDPLVGRRVPLPLASGGRGVYLVNQLCDLVQIRSSPEGTTVRIHAWTSTARDEPRGRWN